MAFDSESPADILHRTMEGSYALNDRKWKKISISAKNLVSALLQVEPGDRISLDDALKHPWFDEVSEKGADHQLLTFQLKKK